MKIRNYLKNARKKTNLTQLEVAKYLNIAVTSYQRIELGKRGTSEENWLKLYHLFNEKIPLHKLMENNTEELFKLGWENSPSEKQ